MKKARQAAQKKEKKKRAFFLFANWEQLLGFLFFAVILSVSTWIILSVKNWVDDPERVVLSQLIITGDNQFTKEQDVRKAILNLGLPNTFIAQNVDDIQQEILRFPWIKQVSVRKQWPDRLIVNIVEYQPKYYWNEIFLLDENGTEFNVPQDRINGETLSKLYGPIGQGKRILEQFEELKLVTQDKQNKNIQLMITQVYTDERNAWQLIVKPCIKTVCFEENSIRLKLGREKLIERYKRFLRFFENINNDIEKHERIIEIDLRYENGISIKKQNIEQQLG
ncbi:FtsQ-type POTRA domain-containing protein [Orbaceae bacterium ac157xtp]